MSDSQGIPTSEFFCTQGPAARALGRSEQQALSSLLRPKHTHTHTRTWTSLSLSLPASEPFQWLFLSDACCVKI